MNDTQLFITISYGALVLLSIVILVVILRSVKAREAGAAEVDHDKLAAMENRWFLFVCVLLVGFLFATIFQVPYGRTSTDEDAQVVKVVGQQFGWAVQPAQVQAGKPVKFVLSSKDVQHGFGVYKGTKLIFQVQVPAKGQQQNYVHTFDEKGSYEILCLEFCGYQHHAMRGAFKVQ